MARTAAALRAASSCARRHRVAARSSSAVFDGRPLRNAVPLQVPQWLDTAESYYSQILGGASDPVTVYSYADGQEVSSTAPGRPRLHLVRSPGGMVVRDGDQQEIGIIKFAVPGVRYVMSQGDRVVWTLSVRSWLRKHWCLDVAGSETWA